ncbi:MAG: diguanylate cyclase [Actinomycetia bacterium]|nr:diguanylate cyclase [Actinomycetes bacterium]MCH9767903.1 diguanylate cyclase [Actinomycetes bacterium]
MTWCAEQSAGQTEAELDRLVALDSFAILDTPPEEAFDDLTALAAHVCATPMAVVSFIDAGRQWFKSQYGFELSGTSRDSLPYGPEFSADTLLEVPDTRLDARFSSHPMIAGEPRVRFFAAAPLVTAEGHVLGALCVMDVEPRALSDLQRKHLRALANQVLSQLELRNQARRFAAEVKARLAVAAELRKQQRMLDGVLKYTDVLIFAKDVEGRFVMTNRAFERASAVGEGGLIGLTDHDLFDPEVAEEYRRLDAITMKTREWQIVVEGVPHADGTVPTYRTAKFPLIDENDEVIGIGGVSADVTELAEARAAHAEAEERWRALVERCKAAVFLIDSGGVIAYANPEAVALCGAARAERIESRPIADFVRPDDRRALEALLSETLADDLSVRDRRGVLQRLDGRTVVVEFNATAVNASGVRMVQVDLRDVSAAAAANAALKLSASTDPLTGLLNKPAWDAQIKALRTDAHYSDTSMTVAVADLDNFKAYNDTHGHTAGDALLQRFCAAAGASLRRDDVFARWGGEEFLIAMPDTRPEQADVVLNRIRACVPAGQTCSIGYTSCAPAESLSDAVIRADKALYQAKALGKNQLCVV